MGRLFWTPELIAEVRRRATDPDRPSVDAIAEDLHITRKCMRNMMHREGIVLSGLCGSLLIRWTPERVAEVTALLTAPDRGSIADIAADLGISKNCLSGLIDRKKIALSPGPADRGVTRRYKPRMDPALRAKPKSRAKPRPQPVSDRAPDRALRPYVPTAAALKRQASGGVRGQRGGFPSVAKEKRLAAEAKAMRPELDRQIADAIAAGKVTKCPPGWAWGASSSSWLNRVGY